MRHSASMALAAPPGFPVNVDNRVNGSRGKCNSNLGSVLIYLLYAVLLYIGVKQIRNPALSVTPLNGNPVTTCKKLFGGAGIRESSEHLGGTGLWTVGNPPISVLFTPPRPQSVVLNKSVEVDVGSRFCNICNHFGHWFIFAITHHQYRQRFACGLNHVVFGHHYPCGIGLWKICFVTDHDREFTHRIHGVSPRWPNIGNVSIDSRVKVAPRLDRFGEVNLKLASVYAQLRPFFVLHYSKLPERSPATCQRPLRSLLCGFSLSRQDFQSAPSVADSANSDNAQDEIRERFRRNEATEVRWRGLLILIGFPLGFILLFYIEPVYANRPNATRVVSKALTTLGYLLCSMGLCAGLLPVYWDYKATYGKQKKIVPHMLIVPQKHLTDNNYRGTVIIRERI